MYTVHRSKIPIVPAEAITIHKSQGSTYTYVVVHTGKRKLSGRLAYVAYSRVTSLNGLFIDGEFNAPNINKYDEGKLEIERLRKEKPLKFTHLFPQDYKR